MIKNERVHVECYARSLHKYNEELCGDKVEIRRNDESCIMVLADGLGSGVKANILSTLTSTIISEMIKEGAGIDEVVETITATLPECQERHVAYSTFTIMQVFYDGTVKLVEFDNPETIVLRNKRALDLPRKIVKMGNRTIKLCEFKSVPNDFILFFSDGIIHAGIGSVLNLDWDHQQVKEHMLDYYRITDTAKDVTQILLATINDLYQGHCGDDSTVATAKIVPATESCVMVGPPVRKEDDVAVVNRLIRANGKKICCGGTTSQIVSRVTGREMTMGSLESLVADVPPMAYINGIDLVTEGVLTLQKVNATLAECRRNQQFMDELLFARGDDGASRMACMLLEECTRITFLVGCSDNPAHQSIAYSTISLNAKKRLIEKMADNLEALGKIVSIEYY